MASKTSLSEIRARPQIIAGRQNAFNEIKAVSTHTNVIPPTFKYKPGTVVESDVVTPNHVNFYLQAHASPNGTVRSVHYNVLKDTCGYDMKKLQDMPHRRLRHESPLSMHAPPNKPISSATDSAAT
ncbi:uncharacterized protein RAG0_13360 [Rhynchosporium agropyri]|uniref:Piwi domain-containing protein n=1 Tax=Rhynchosporium agropyri TaxID=914238 RepID=A0A1E1LCQ2_9HELO|nr:uncharacterized protein RAG0_13360 [Rhynchosporium agropyri]